jgi:hypothetical protein
MGWMADRLLEEASVSTIANLVPGICSPSWTPTRAHFGPGKVIVFAH